MPAIASLEDLKAAQKDLLEAKDLTELKGAFKKWRRIGWKNVYGALHGKGSNHSKAGWGRHPPTKAGTGRPKANGLLCRGRLWLEGGTSKQLKGEGGPVNSVGLTPYSVPNCNIASLTPEPFLFCQRSGGLCQMVDCSNRAT